MLTHLEFRSDRFPAFEGEEELVNPGLWGKRLAEFLREGLCRAGIEAGEPVAEDWGWAVPLPSDPFGIWVGCGRYQEYPDGFLCFIYPKKFSIKRLFSQGKLGNRVSELQQAIDRILVEDAGIHAKRWWTDDEFNEQSKQ